MALSVYCVVTLAVIGAARCLEMSAPLNRFKRSYGNEPGSCGSASRQPLFRGNSNNFTVDLRMPRVVPPHSDSYMCMAFPVPVTNQDVYIVDFTPYASMDTVHHMLLYGCQTPASTSGHWDCGGSLGTCKDESSIMYAWARNAPPTKLPKDVGFKVGGSTGKPYFVLQMHYGDVSAFRDHHRDCSGLSLTLTTQPQPFTAGIYLLMTVDTVIPPGNQVTNADSACDYTSPPIYPFAFRTHTHRLGKVVSGYRVRDGKWTLIGRQSPQLPQAFYPAKKDVDVKYGDTLAARCVFTGEGKTSKTYIGGTSDDEMCNFYIMYYMDRKHAIPFFNCMSTGSKELFQKIPAEANVPITVPPSLMHSMHMGHSEHPDQAPEDAAQSLDQGDLFSLFSKLLGQSKDVGYFHKLGSSNMLRAQDELVAHIQNIMLNKELGSPTGKLVYRARKDPVLVRDRVHKFHQLEDMAKPQRSMLLAEGRDFHLEQETDWPQELIQLGQVSGLAIDSDSNLVIFHRGVRSWDLKSFDSNGRYQQKSLGPIQQSTILVLDTDEGKLLRASGRDKFYMPHGITTDGDNYWVTDVALHQVFKMSGDGRDIKLVTLGEAFIPGSDHYHFCKPTDVAVDSKNGNIFISDGYCNARILKFSREGEYMSQWGAGYSDRRRRVPFRIPHSLVFLPDRREVCVADRENGRIQCFIAETGEFVKEIKKEDFAGEVFAIAYSPVGDGLIYAVNGQSPYDPAAPIKGFVINYSTKEIIDTFQPDNKDFEMPHDIAVTKDGSVFVGDVGTKEAYKFTSEKMHRSVKKAGIKVQELEEVEAFVQTKLRPEPKPKSEHKVVSATAVPQKQTVVPQTQKMVSIEEKNKVDAKPDKDPSVFPAVMTTLLLVPLLLVVVMGAFICYRKRNQFEVKSDAPSVGGILGKLRGKAVGGLNLGNFFATHKGYTRQGFDQLSTEGSDQERIDEDSSDSENEEYSALPPPRTS